MTESNRPDSEESADTATVPIEEAVPPRSRGEMVAGAARSSLVRRVLVPVQTYVHTDAVGGLVLLAVALLAFVWANSPWGHVYQGLWETRASITVGPWELTRDVRHWVNDGLMTLFFFVIGLEVRREITIGAMADARRVVLPVGAAVGGMLVPAVTYAAITAGGPGAAGWGIPVATDVAFALGVLALVGRGLPDGARLLLLSLAVIDDIGGIVVIAVVYSQSLSWVALGTAAGILGTIMALRAGGVRHVLVYVVLGVLMWLAILASGVHPTLTGVAIGMIAPVRRDFGLTRFARAARTLLPRFDAALDRHDEATASATLGQLEELSRGTEAPVERLQRVVHPWVSFFVLPVFALANAGVVLPADMVTQALASPVTLGVVAGLVVGKPVGIVLASWLTVRLGWAVLPPGLTWRHVSGIGILAGIGFTVSLFIGDTAFSGREAGEEARFGVLLASLAAGLLGYVWLRCQAPGPEVRL